MCRVRWSSTTDRFLWVHKPPARAVFVGGSLLWFSAAFASYAFGNTFSSRNQTTQRLEERYENFRTDCWSACSLVPCRWRLCPATDRHRSAMSSRPIRRRAGSRDVCQESCRTDRRARSRSRSTPTRPCTRTRKKWRALQLGAVQMLALLAGQVRPACVKESEVSTRRSSSMATTTCTKSPPAQSASSCWPLEPAASVVWLLGQRF